MQAENQTELERSGVLRWHQARWKGQGVTIAILDDGGGPGPDMPYASSPVNDCSQERHGTWVAETYHEAAPDAKVLLFNYFYNSLGAIEWIIQHADEIDMINCSFHSNQEDPNFRRLLALDIPIFCAAGNDPNHEERYPALYDWTISVGAWEAVPDKRAAYSSGGQLLDCMAYSHISVPTQHDLLDGTSFSSPFAAGMYSVWLSKHKAAGMLRLGIEGTRQLIQSNCIDEERPGRDYNTGYGLFVLPKIPVEEEKEMRIELPAGGHEATKDGQKVPLNVEPIIYQDHVMVGIRDVAELLGYQVDWDAERRVVIITDENK